MSFKPTAQQQNALDATGQVLVSAAAGSGKTAVLCQRIMQLITDEQNPVDADRLLVVTFTNAAAGEMRARIRRLLTERLRSNPDSARLQKQLFLLTRANICTIDSFCKNLVTEYYYLIGCLPDIKLIESGRRAIMSERCLNAVIERYLLEKDEVFLKLCDCFGSKALSNTLQKAILGLHDYLYTLAFPERYINRVLSMYNSFNADDSIWMKTLFQQKASVAESLLLRMNKTLSEIEEYEELNISYGDSFRYAHTQLEQLHEYLCSVQHQKVIELAGQCQVPRLKSLSGDFEPESLKNSVQKQINDFKTLIKQLNAVFGSEEIIKFDVVQTRPLVEKLFETVGRYEDEMQREKQRLGVMDFTDVEYRALHLLVDENGKPTALSEELSDRFYEVCVDEYQDTNELQTTIFNALSGGGKRLFMVGDVKQSIYRFRKANPSLFLEYKNSLPPYREGADMPRSKVIMSGNFRSVPEICKFVNFTFGAIMSPAVGEMSYSEEDRLVAMRESDRLPEPAVQLKLLDLAGAKDATAKEYEAEYIAGYIRGCVERGEYYAEQDRPLRYADFAVLVRSRNANSELMRAFKKAGVPCRTDKNDGFFDSPELICMLNLLAVIDNPHRRLAMLGVMTGALYNFSDEELAQIRINSPRGDFYAALLQYRDRSQRVDRLLSELAEYRTMSRYMSLPQLLYRLYDRTGFLYIAQSSEGGATARANLLMLVDYATEYETDSIHGLSGFVRHIERCKNENAKIEGAGSAGDDAVALMSIHNSKGMQFPVCICANMSGKRNDGDAADPVQVSEHCGVGIRQCSNGVFMPSLPQLAALQENRRGELSEELRVLYVAMTRAQQRLVLCMSVSKPDERLAEIGARIQPYFEQHNAIDPQYIINAGSYTEWMLAVSLIHPSAGELREMCGNPVFVSDKQASADFELVNSVSLDAAEPVAAVEEDAIIAEQLINRLQYTYPYEGVNRIAAKQTASRLAHDHSRENAELDFTARPLFLQHTHMTAAERGSATHRFLQLCDTASVNAQHAAQSLLDAQRISKDEFDALDIKRLQVFFDSPLFARMAAAERRGELYREHEFMVELPAADFADKDTVVPEGECVVIQGVVDAMFIEDGALCIVDYKTDRVKTADELAIKYRVQLEIYARAMAQCFENSNVLLRIYSLWLGKEVEL